jgi:hypothetical protein
MTEPTAPTDPVFEAALDALGAGRGKGGDSPDSTRRFPDGVAFRIEIPSVEGPACLDAVLEEASTLDVPVRRVSQGSGVGMLTDAELDRMASTSADAGIEVSLFARPGAGWGSSASARSTGGATLAAAAWGRAQLRACLADVVRAADHGFRSVLIADLGVLAAFAELRRAGRIPPDMQAKVSVMLASANAASARVLEDLGAGSINVPGDLPLAELAAIRAATSVPLDVYVESPDDLGGMVRLHDAPEMIRVAAPIHLKMGLRNAPALYPWGRHLESTAIAMGRERIRRARLVLELLERAGVDTATSAPGAAGLAVPAAPRT